MNSLQSSVQYIPWAYVCIGISYTYYNTVYTKEFVAAYLSLTIASKQILPNSRVLLVVPRSGAITEFWNRSASITDTTPSPATSSPLMLAPNAHYN